MNTAIKDEKIRGILLNHFYNLRHSNGGWCPISETILSPYPVELRIIGSVCQHLSDTGFIEWRSLEDDYGVVEGMAKITGRGVAAVESGNSSELPIHFPASATSASKASLKETGSEAISNKLSNKIFVVHGHDEGAREAVARFVERLGFEAIILHEQTNCGRTIIEKIEVHGNVGFAVVLLTPDDFGGKAGGEAKPRARQNVVLELGYFVGRLGRGRVCALLRGELEIPSDFSGVAYQSMDSAGAWKSALAKELEDAGYGISWSRIMA